MSAAACLCCGAAAVEVLVDFGPQPPSNRFVRHSDPDGDAHPLVIGQCNACGLIQLVNPMPHGMVKSRFEWLTYNEPEGHLDKLVGNLTELDGVSKGSKIFGLTYKDDSTLGRFNRFGYDRTFRYDLEKDFGIDDVCAGLETIQAAVDEKAAGRLGSRYGQADLLIVRHVLEHAHDPARFLRALGSLVKPGGYLVFELPDCSKFIDACDYSFVWEEHICYFSPATLRRFVEHHGFAVTDLLNYVYPLEDSLVVVLRAGGAGGKGAMSAPGPGHELAAGRRFGQCFNGTRQQIRRHLEQLHAQGRHVAVFGAGHLAAKFLNLFGLKDFVDCVVDDDPHKQGLLMPGSRLPIMGSSVLAEREINLCLLSLSPESEQKVLAKKQDYVTRGGQFASIFALSPLALRVQ